MVKQRMPQSVKDSRELNDDEKRFVGKVELDNLSALSLDELAYRFEDIGQQAQLMQGRILLEARRRFRSDNEFGAWIEETGGAIYSASRQHRTKLMNLARFFETREIDKISISAAYEISAPINADIAIEIYENVRGKNMPLAEVRKQIARAKGENVPVTVGEKMQQVVNDSIVTMPEKIEIIATELKEKSKYDLIMEILEGLTGGEAKKLLRDCMHAVKW